MSGIYTKRTWATGDTITAARLQNIEDGVENSFDCHGLGPLSPVAIPLICRPRHSASFETVGSFTSDGYLFVPSQPGFNWNTSSGKRGFPESEISGNMTGTSEAVALSKAFLLPALAYSGTITKIEGRITVPKIWDNGFSGNLTKIELIPIKVDSGGTETVLGTYGTGAISIATGSSGSPTRTQQEISSGTVSLSFASTDRLGVRIKLYGTSGNVAGQVHGSLYSEPAYDDMSDLGTYHSPIAIWFT